MSAGKARRGLVMGTVRESGTIVLVAALSSFYAAVLVMGSSLILTLAEQSSRGGSEELGIVAAMLTVASSVFIGVALYVATIVMSGCVATVIAGRVRQIALLRLLGADASALRASVRSGCSLAGLVGAVVGVPIGVLTANITRGILVDRGSVPPAPYPNFVSMTLVVILPVVAAAWLAGLIGSRRVLEVSPAEAFAGTAAAVPTKRASRIRGGFGVALIVIGLALLVLAAMWGETNPQTGFLTAFFGSIISATGVLLGASLVLPPTVRLLSGLLGRDATTQIARRNAVADPMRTTRSTLGLVIGVTLVTTFASGFAALDAALDNWNLDFEQRLQARQILSVISTILLCIVVISAIIAAVGFVSTMSLTVVQRTRELGLLRALGFTRGQVRMMITKESIALGVTAVVVGILLGLFYGSMGAQSLIGAENDGFVWGIPGSLLAIITIASILLVLAASQPPAQRAISIAPHDALRAET